jgi:hypothetical protein
MPDVTLPSGYGGSIGMADPKAGIAIGITLDRLEIDLLGGDRVRRVVQLAVEAAQSA